MEPERHEPAALRRDVERALEAALDLTRILPVLRRLARATAEGSDDSIFAHTQLAELLADRCPWRASLHARRVTRARPDDERAWAVLGFCQAKLGHHRFAISAYERALQYAPQNAAYAHNIGHLLDVALGSAHSALPWLERACDARPDCTDIAASFAHALARTGQLKRAASLLAPRAGRRTPPEHVALLAWIKGGAAASGSTTPAGAAVATKAPRGRARLMSELDTGLRSLPFNAAQRSRAVDLAQALLAWGPTEQSRAMAAAVAFAVVAETELPLSLAEVAASFRVAARTLRAHLPAVRARSDARARLR